MTTYDLCSGAALVDHAQEIGYQLAMIEGGQGDTTAAVAEIDTLARKLGQLRERLTGQAVPVDEHRDVPDVTPQIEYSTRRFTPRALPADLVAHVEQTWRDGHEELPADMPHAEFWAARASSHDAMATAYNQLFDAITGPGRVQGWVGWVFALVGCVGLVLWVGVDHVWVAGWWGFGFVSPSRRRGSR